MNKVKKFLQSDSESLSVTTQGGEILSVPNDLNIISSFVFLEQEDWFEEEIIFLRSFAENITGLVDVGANFGAYSFALAKKNKNSSVLAVDPNPRVHFYLEKSKSINNFDMVIIERSAASDETAERSLRQSASPELSGFHVEDSSLTSAVAVSAKPLDEIIVEKSEASNFNILKVDAEGHEMAVIRGANRYITNWNPIIIIEIKHGGKGVSFECFENLQLMGYVGFRYCTALECLVPFRRDEFDQYFLNIICVHRDKVNMLFEIGFLVFGGFEETSFAADQIFEKQTASIEYCKIDINGRVSDYPSTIEFNAEDAVYNEMLSYLNRSLDRRIDKSKRFNYLNRAYEISKSGESKFRNYFEFLSSKARIALLAGFRSQYLEVLDDLRVRNPPALYNVPFLPFSGAVGNVGGVSLEIMARQISQRELLRYGSYSSRFVGNAQAVVNLLFEIVDSGLGDREMRRKLFLMVARNGQPSQLKMLINHFGFNGSDFSVLNRSVWDDAVSTWRSC